MTIVQVSYSRFAKPAVSSPKAAAASLTSAIAASISGVVSNFAFSAVRGTNDGFCETNANEWEVEIAARRNVRYFIVVRVLLSSSFDFSGLQRLNFFCTAICNSSEIRNQNDVTPRDII